MKNKDFDLPVIKKKNASFIVAKEIEKLIINNVVNPGDQLPSERELANRFGVGRYTIREGLAVLQARGIIQVFPGKGIFVNQDVSNALVSMLNDFFLQEEKSLEDLVETRCMIESSSALLAARRATDEDITVLEGHLQVLKDAGNSQEQLNDADENFHFSIAKATGNPSFEVIVKGVIRTVKLEIRKNIFELSKMINLMESGNDELYTKEFYEQNYQYHVDIFQAIRSHNEQEAYFCMYRHLSEGILIRYLDRKLKEAHHEPENE
ncbi:MAG TPA: FadR/GntR family transcriptional regulator [Spirochaetales bacterium]|nr:FadR/GntR family transcriptional regulator [Spirochaetales bacterium]